MIHHTVALELKQPVEQVFALVIDARSVPTWQSDLVEMEQLTEGPVRVGTQYREVRRQGQRQVENRAEVQVLETNKRFTVHTITQPHVEVSYAFEPRNGGTQLAYEFTMHTSGFMRLLEPLIAGAIKKQSEQDFQRLQQILAS